MAKCIERESVANYQFVPLRLIYSSACFSETLNFSHTAKHLFLVMASMLSLFSIARLPLLFPCLPPQASDEKASHSASSSGNVTCPHDNEVRRKRGESRQHHAKSRANNHAGVDFATPTDAKWIHPSPESDSALVEASGRFHDDGQSNFRGQVHRVYSILTKSFCFP